MVAELKIPPVELRVVTGDEAVAIEASSTEIERFPWPTNTAVVYAFEGGRVVGRSAILSADIVEGTWTALDKRGTSLALRLLRRVEELHREHGKTHVMAFAAEAQPEVGAYLERVGYTRLPLVFYSKQLVDDELDPVLVARGAAFHEKLFALYPEDGHEDDPLHNYTVGLCLKTAFEDSKPIQAVALYNAYIAGGAPYDGIELISASPDCVVIKMGPHGQIAVRRDGVLERVN